MAQMLRAEQSLRCLDLLIRRTLCCPKQSEEVGLTKSQRMNFLRIQFQVDLPS